MEYCSYRWRLDILSYRIGFAAQTTFIDVYPIHEGEPPNDEVGYEEWDWPWGPIRTFNNKTDLKKFFADQGSSEGFYIEERIVPEELPKALHSVKLQMRSIINAVQADKYKVFLTGKGNYRDDVVYYKANRNRSERPFHYQNIRDYLVKYWGARIVDGREADDALAITQYRDYNQLLESEVASFYTEEEISENLLTIICTIDKDLKMVPGWHYNFVKKEFLYQTGLDGLRWFYTQMLQGDVADNIPGFVKLTGKRVSRWAPILSPLSALTTEEEMYGYVADLFLSEFIEMDENSDYPTSVLSEAIDKTLTETGRLLWMQQTKDDIWEPPKNEYSTKEGTSSAASKA